MLGFSPLAATPLSDDGVIETGIKNLYTEGILTTAVDVGSPTLAVIYSLVPVGITTGSPSVGDSSLVFIVDLVAGGIITGTSEVGTTSASITSNLSAAGVVVGAPEFGSVVILQTHVLSGVDIDTGEVVFTRPVAFSQLPFDPNYNRTRVVFAVSENRVVIVPISPRKPTQDIRSENRTTRI